MKRFSEKKTGEKDEVIDTASGCYVTISDRYVLSQYYDLVIMLRGSGASAGFRGGARGQGPEPPPKRAFHHVHVFSHMYDMCVQCRISPTLGPPKMLTRAP